jgi:hypothetical protein
VHRHLRILLERPGRTGDRRTVPRV